MRIESTQELGKAISKRRKELGYTQIQLSEYTGLSASFISNLENGKETAEVGKTLFIIQVLGMNLELLNRGE